MPTSPANPFPLAMTLAQASAPSAAAPSTFAYWIAIVLVAAGLTIILIVALSAIVARRAANAPTASATLTVDADPTSTTQEAQDLLRLMGEAEDLCTRLGRQLDDKADRIERLLVRAEGRFGQPATFQDAVVRSPTPPPAPVAAPLAPHPEIVTRPVAVPAAAVSSASAPPRSTAPLPSLDPLTGHIYQLADAGVPAAQIAQQLGQHTGKVELILALRSS